MNMLFLTFVFPLLGFFLLSFSRGKLSENISAVIGVGSMALSALTTAYIAREFLAHPPETGAYTQVLWTWMQIGDFAPRIALHLDGLSLTMLCVVTGVGFLIHLFASWYMRGEEGYSRFFAYMNLFVASMLYLVLGDNLLFLYFGWEGVGLCSYLLIGFYFKHTANGHAAMKAFIITRIGDVFMALGLFVLFRELGTLNIQDILQAAPLHANRDALELAAVLLVGGAVGKSAQLPLQTWLADAMAGPTPVSALIHAATMVTAGVYLIARMHTLFEISPDVLYLVGVIGAATLLLAGFSALVQTDIKRILAYSTMSQIGYMFLALGAGAWDAAIFHLMTHAFFKALLFLSAGAVIVACHHKQDIFQMGGLWKKLLLVYACFIVGGSALAALPVVTAGFYSKDEILWLAYANGKTGFFYAGLFGALLTSLYTFRLIFTVFHGEAKTEAHAGHGVAHVLPLTVLLVLSTFIGAMIHPPLAGVLPDAGNLMGDEHKHLLEIISGAVAIAGIAIAAWLFLPAKKPLQEFFNTTFAHGVRCLWKYGWGFDVLYDRVFVKPYLWLVRVNSRDLIDIVVESIPVLMRGGHDVVSATENGRVRWYAASIAAGAAAVLVIVLWF
ncbi:MAG TPA: NADH-quinone oxidoreductase subunit L [Pseudomonadales bacterium]|nr:NADH-quinone oxidoreductase subunit L [Pseudomonadales bacterium]